MKKVLLLSLILAVGMTGFAQTKNQAVKAPKLKVGTADVHKRAMGKQEAVQAFEYLPSTSVASTRYESLDEYTTMITNYDLQGNGFVANRMALFQDGTVGVTATFSHAGTAAAPDRGTGYNLVLPDGELLFPDGPEARIEEEKTGWPSYAQWGEDGEIVVAHTGVGTMVCYTREHKGEGEWTRHELPNPNLGVSAQELTWPRVITSGPNHNIIHVIAADQDSDNTAITYTYYLRSTDAENWEVGFMPTLEENGEEGLYSADYYALAANGNTVAILLTGDIMAHTIILKSTDNGETWQRIIVWKNPYAGMDWETDENSLFGEDNAMYGPETGAICIDNNGMVHAAFSSHHYYHAELGTSYNFYYGGSIDGIFYWNEEMYAETNGTITPPVWDYEGSDGHVHVEGTDHDCFRMWWPADNAGEYIARNFDQPLAGFIDPVFFQDWSNDNFYYEDYYSYWQGASALPAICVDESGAIAIAFSCPDGNREPDGNGKYLRGIFMSYIDVPYTFGDAYDEENPGGCYYYNEEWLMQDFMHMMDECVAVSSIQNTTNKEFWISYQADDLCGFGIGNSATQGAINDNTIWVAKVVPAIPELSTNEAVNPMTSVNVYPNPVNGGNVTFQINASQASEMNIAIYNITGQKVMEQNVNVALGVSEQHINVSSLNSGIYFATVKANGFENTVKFIVK